MQRLTPTLLTVLWLLAWHGGTQASSRVPTFGVKLCGREFIRAVIFTCGGSRWRRSEAMQTVTAFRLLSLAGDPSDVESEEEEMFSEWTGSIRPHHPDVMDYGAPPSWRDTPGGRHEAAAEDALRGVERRGREAALGLSNTCCKWGCSKSQISSLC
ncbi:relaxin-3 isoform 2-T2 [Pelodytes ibericus]